MAHTEKLIHAPVDVVFAVLCDPRTYEHFVIGTKKVRRFDPRWPEPGSTLHHTVGLGLLKMRDRTDAVSWEPPLRLVARPHLRPFVVTETVFELEARRDDTLLRLDEYAVGGPLRPLWLGPLDGLMALRNRGVVRRIAHLAADRHAIRQAEAPSPAEL